MLCLPYAGFLELIFCFKLEGSQFDCYTVHMLYSSRRLNRQHKRVALIVLWNIFINVCLSDRAMNKKVFLSYSAHVCLTKCCSNGGQESFVTLESICRSSDTQDLSTLETWIHHKNCLSKLSCYSIPLDPSRSVIFQVPPPTSITFE